jgi:hypothetical protein
MGNVTLALSTTKGIVGNTTINDMTLVPGNNTLPMTGIMDQALVSLSLNNTGFVELEIVGQSAVYHGEHLVYYVSTFFSIVLFFRSCRICSFRIRE